MTVPERQIPDAIVAKGVEALISRSKMSREEATEFAEQLAGDVRAVLEAVGYVPPKEPLVGPPEPPWRMW